MPFYNSESHFAQVPSIDIQRSKMKIPFDHKTSFDFGRLVPLYVDSDILPGDTVRVTQSFVARLQTLLTPVMDDARLELAAFFVPHRLVWNNFKKMMGESDNPWIQPTQYAIPTISSPSGGFNTGTVADYMGLPVGVQWSNTDANAPDVLPFRAYAQIWNDFYRDTNLQYAINIDKTDANATGSNGTTYLTDSVCGGVLLPVAKTHDYFTSALPSAQRAAAPVSFPLINKTMAPVKATDKDSGNRASVAHVQPIPGVVNPSQYHGVALDSNSNLKIGSGQTTVAAASLIPLLKLESQAKLIDRNGTYRRAQICPKIYRRKISRTVT